MIVLENVVGAITSTGGADFRGLCDTLAGGGYWFGPMIIDAVHFLPQSRPRLFIVAVSHDMQPPESLTLDRPMDLWHPEALREAKALLPERLARDWIWWQLPAPPQRVTTLEDLIEETPSGVPWHHEEQTARLLSLMTDCNLKKVEDAKRAGRRRVGTVYRRTRPDGHGGKSQRAEVRFDGISGCLRTPAGGSSRQTVLVVEGELVRSRLLTPREAARLMGLPDDYALPANYNEAYHLLGDGLAVPAVRWLAKCLLTPLALAQRGARRAA